MTLNCERDHADVRVAMGVMQRELDSIQKLLEAVTEILRDNLVTLSGHDKASSDWRVALLASVESILTRVRGIEIELLTAAQVHEDVEEFHADQAAAMDLIRDNSDILRRLVGLLPDAAPPPLSRDFHEMLGHVRTLNHHDPRSGDPLSGWAFWYSRFADVFYLTVAAAGLMALYRAISPYLNFAKPH